MFDIGFWELVILFGLGLMVLGPERMPKVASKLGRWAGQARQMARSLSRQLRDEIEPVESSIRAADQAMRTDFSKRRPDVGETAVPESESAQTVEEDKDRERSSHQPDTPA